MLITDPVGTPQWSEVFEGNLYILRKPFAAGGFVRVISSSGNRPYIAGKTAGRWTWRPYTPIPAQMFFTEQELQLPSLTGGKIMIEPVASRSAIRTRCGFANAGENSSPRLHYPFVQCGPVIGTKWLEGAEAVPTTTFRQALAVLSVCRALVTTEGGLMHGAAAVGTPAVVLWSEFIAPNVTGYRQHHNIRHATRTCGMRVNCPSCRKSMEAITVREVAGAPRRS